MGDRCTGFLGISAPRGVNLVKDPALVVVGRVVDDSDKAIGVFLPVIPVASSSVQIVSWNTTRLGMLPLFYVLVTRHPMQRSICIWNARTCEKYSFRLHCRGVLRFVTTALVLR